MRSTERQAHKKKKNIIGIMQSVLILFIVIIVVMMMIQIGNLQGTARVINYAGLVRGATQREIKLEITGTQNDELIQYLDDIISDGEAIEVKCQFCNKAYHFDVDELKEMRK